MSYVLRSTNGKVIVRLYKDELSISKESIFIEEYDGDMSLDYFESLCQTIKDYHALLNPKEVYIDNLPPYLNLNIVNHKLILATFIKVEELLSYFTERFKEN